MIPAFLSRETHGRRLSDEDLITIGGGGGENSAIHAVIDLRAYASSFCGILEKVIAVEAIEERESTGIARR